MAASKLLSALFLVLSVAVAGVQCAVSPARVIDYSAQYYGYRNYYNGYVCMACE